MGRRFYEATMPALVEALERLNANLERLAHAAAQHATTAPPHTDRRNLGGSVHEVGDLVEDQRINSVDDSSDARRACVAGESCAAPSFNIELAVVISAVWPRGSPTPRAR